jgi:hypothetical protein
VNVDNADDEACAVDRTCSDSGCGCSPVGTIQNTPVTAGAGSKPVRRGLGAVLLAVACAAACLAVPLAVGGAAAVSGALAGKWWLVAGVVVIAAVAVAVLSRRRGERIC